jgi:hypothetical protein
MVRLSRRVTFPYSTRTGTCRLRHVYCRSLFLYLLLTHLHEGQGWEHSTCIRMRIHGLWAHGTGCIIDVGITDVDATSNRSKDPQKFLTTRALHIWLLGTYQMYLICGLADCPLSR